MKWIKSFLSEGTQHVKMKVFFSDAEQIPSSVPQETILWYFSFIIFYL